MMVVSGYFVDPNGDALEYSHSVDTPGVVGTALAANEDGDYELTFSPLAAGTAIVTVTATDPGGLSASITINVEVDEEGMQAPEYVGDLPSSIELEPGQEETIDVEGAFVEHEDESLTITFDVSDEDPAIVRVTQDGNEITITALATTGDATVTIIATDEDAKTAEHEITVSVRAELGPVRNSMDPESVELSVGGESRTIDASDYFEVDADIGDLMYTASSDPVDGVVSVEVDGTMVELTPGRQWLGHGDDHR